MYERFQESLSEFSSDWSVKHMSIGNSQEPQLQNQSQQELSEEQDLTPPNVSPAVAAIPTIRNILNELRALFQTTALCISSWVCLFSSIPLIPNITFFLGDYSSCYWYFCYSWLLFFGDYSSCYWYFRYYWSLLVTLLASMITDVQCE